MRPDTRRQSYLGFDQTKCLQKRRSPYTLFVILTAPLPPSGRQRVTPKRYHHPAQIPVPNSIAYGLLHDSKGHRLYRLQKAWGF
ncbi:hypothetical protein LH51_07010 [Nitrincola sp. A-D6]|nr:hypothetical protein LH51_07010 [Nitrincola sp. A-D6]